MKKTFILGASTIPGEFIITKLLSDLIKRLPEIEIKVDISDSLKVYEKIKNKEIELGIIGTKFNDEEIQYITLVKDDKLVLIAPPDHPLTKKDNICIVDIKGQNFINREFGSGTRAAYEKAFKDAGLSLDDFNIVAEISDTEGVIQAVENRAGISVVSELAAKEAIMLGKVAVIDIPILKMKRDFYVITKKTEELSDTANTVLSIITELLK